MIEQQLAEAQSILDGARVHTPREWEHRQKMERKDLNRDERSARRVAQYERLKAAAPLTVERMRKWLKSPYAFRGAV